MAKFGSILKIAAGLLETNETKARRARLEGVQANWETIKNISNPTTQEQLAAASANWEALLYIKPEGGLNFSDELFEAANYKLGNTRDYGTPLGIGQESQLCISYCKPFKKNGQAVGRSMLMVMRDGNNIDKAEVLNDDITEIAIQNGLRDYGKLPTLTESNQLLLAKVNPEILSNENFRLIKQPCEAIADMAIVQDPKNLLLLEKPTENQILAATKSQPELWPDVLKRNGLMIKHIDSPSDELQIIAVTQEPRAICEITKPCTKAQDIAFEKHPTLAALVENSSPASLRKALFGAAAIIEKQNTEISSLRGELKSAGSELSHTQSILEERTRERDHEAAEHQRWRGRPDR